MSVRRLYLFAVIYGFIFFLFYPSIFAFRDESDYLAMAYVFRQGNIFLENSLIPVRSVIQVGTHLVSDYPPGQPLLLLPFTFLGWKAVFVSNLIFHLLGTFVFMKFLERFRFNRFWSLLYLFFPPFTLFSRTLMADIPAAVLFLAGTYIFYFRKAKGWAGIVYGISCVIRPAHIIFVFPFAVSAVFRFLRGESRRSWAVFIAGYSTVISLLGGYFFVLYGIPWLKSHIPLSEGFLFSHQSFLRHFPFYLLHLSLIYPLMILGPVFASVSRKTEMLASICAGLLFYCFYFFRDEYASAPATWVFGARFLFPAVSLLLLMYVECAENIMLKLEPRPVSLGKIFLPMVLIAGTLGIHLEHQKVLNVQAEAKDFIYAMTVPEGSHVLYDREAAELFQAEWGNRAYHPITTENIKDKLNQVNFQKNVYLVLRDAFYAGKDIPPGFDKQILKELSPYRFQLIAKKSGIEIYQCSL